MSRLSWNEIRIRAQAFAEEWEGKGYERGETQTFYNEFFEIFGVTRKRVATFEEPVKKLGHKQGFVDLLWKGVLLVEQKSAGLNLEKAKDQAFDYFPGLKEEELPKFVLACDFQNFELFDLVEGEEHKFTLADIPKHVELFGFILGLQKRSFQEQEAVSIKASVLMGRLHDELFDSGYRGHDLERFLVRLLFCLFADDTGIFEPRDIFDELIRTRTKEDGSDLGIWLAHLFQTLDEPEASRATTLDEDLARFPYINGELFRETLRMPSFTSKMRGILLDACQFNWDAVSPAIFGALFQHVSGDAAARRAHGEHYTTEDHITRLIGPLFLDDLREELDSILRKSPSKKEKGLKAFCNKLGSLTFFDPACGCGNFLIIAYREIRKLELKALHALFADYHGAMGSALASQVTVEQFYGIEINEFPARIAEVALWMMDHIMNLQLSLALKQDFRRIPIQDMPHIVVGDALEMNWSSVLEPQRCSYVFGNPPFLGAKIQTDFQRAQVRRLAALGKSGGTLDFVCAWYFKAGAYVQGTAARISFVSTNSITQGEQVAQLWPKLFHDYGLEISFGHRTFEWSSDADNRAHVHVVIIGLTLAKDEPKDKRLFTYPDIRKPALESRHAKLSPYLIDASRLSDPHLVVRKEPKPINSARKLGIGSKPVDGGHLIVSLSEYSNLARTDPFALKFIRPFVDAQDFIYGKQRFIICVHGREPSEIRKSAFICNRLDSCKKWRLSRSSPGTIAIAATPGQYHVNVLPSSSFLVIPRHTSEVRDYAPIGFLGPPIVPSDASIVLLDCTVWEFAVLTSSMHMAWLREIGGRLESRYRYSVGVVYNTFPWPAHSEAQKKKISVLAQAVLDARAAHPTSTLADLYDPVTMPPNLRKAHQALDVAVDRLYRTAPFRNDSDRVEHLLALYEKMTSLFAGSGKAKAKSKPKS